MQETLLALVETMRQHFSAGLRQDEPIRSETRLVLDRLAKLPVPSELSVRPDHPVLRARPDFPDGHTLGRHLAPIARLLPWRYSYEPRPDYPGLENAMAWAELVGPEAPIHHDGVGFGLTLISPGTYYPPHRHPAVELYAVVSGTARWTLAGDTGARPPGSFILHPSNAIHAMRAGQEALLAIYSWTGDIVSPTTYEGC